MELTESSPPYNGRASVVTTIVGEDLPFGGRWVFELEGDPSSTTVTITEEGEVYSALFRFVSRFVMGHHGTMMTYQQDLGRHFGGEVEVEIVPHG